MPRLPRAPRARKRRDAISTAVSAFYAELARRRAHATLIIRIDVTNAPEAELADLREKISRATRRPTSFMLKRIP